jgi:hypothetical protein
MNENIAEKINNFDFSGSQNDIRKINNQTRMLNINKTNKLGFDLKKICYFITSIKNIFCKIDTGKYSAFVDVLNTLHKFEVLFQISITSFDVT